MLADIGLGEILWALLVIYIIINVIIGTVVVIIDLYRSRDLSGLAKAGWVVALLLFPLITVLGYLIIRGDGIGDRAMARATPPTEPPPGYGPPTTPPPGYAAPPTAPPSGPANPASELQTAKALLDEGTISEEEYAKMRERILA